MTDIDSSRRKFLISSAAGLSGLVIAQSSLAGTVTNLLDIHIVENGVHPSGIGENTLALVAPAVCNAIQNLTGKRLRSLPLKHHLPLV